MRSLPLTYCAAAAVAVISLPAPAVLADSAHRESKTHKGSVSVTPSTVTPGGEVELRVDACGKGTSAKGESEAFVSAARFAPADGKGLFAEARIRSDADPRDYEILVTCRSGHGKATGTVTVVHRGRPSPVAPVRAGGGGTATLASDAAASVSAAPSTEQSGPGTRHALTGLGLSAVAAVAVAFRGVRRRRAARG